MAVSLTITDTPASDFSSGLPNSTFTGVNFGTPSSGRLVFLSVNLFDASASGTTVTGVTIGGVTASLAATRATTPSGALAKLYVWWAAVPSGSSGTVVATYNANTGSAVCGIVVYEVDGADTVSPISATNTAASSLGTPSISASITTPSSGGLLAAAGDIEFGPVTWTWTNATKDCNVNDPAFGNWSTASSTSSGLHTVTAANDGASGGGQVGLVLVAIAQASGAVTQLGLTITQGQSISLIALRSKTIALTSAETVRLVRGTNKLFAILSGEAVKIKRSMTKFIVMAQDQIVNPHAGRTNNRTLQITQAQTSSLIARFAKLKSMAITQVQSVTLVRSVTRQTQKIISVLQSQVVHLTTFKVLAMQAVELLHNVIQRIRTLANKPTARIRTLQNTRSRRKP